MEVKGSRVQRGDWEGGGEGGGEGMRAVTWTAVESSEKVFVVVYLDMFQRLKAETVSFCL